MIVPRTLSVRALVAFVAVALAAPATAAATPYPADEAGGTPTAAPGAAPYTVTVVADDAGSKLQVDGEDFFIFGMNWGYIPVGHNYRYDLWSQPDDFIEEVLDHDMPMLRDMGVNAIRLFSIIPPKWVRYIYENYGIYTAINHLVGRYGFTVDGVFVNPVDYSDEATRAAIVADVVAMVERYRDTPGVLLWMLGNENNYGLAWESFEIEALPAEERSRARAVHLYSLFGEVAAAIKTVDTAHPVMLVNGDMQFVDLIAEHGAALDIMGANVYRGASARDLFAVVKEKLGLPFAFTEFGADAYDAKRGREDADAQAAYLRSQWQEIYEQSWGKGRVGNAIGGFIFQWSDGWWKYKQETRLDVHDTHASWPNPGYPHDYMAGANNMNEEWFGICAKGPPDERGFFEVYPRPAYYILKEAFTLAPYAESTTLAAIRAHFGRLPVEQAAGPYRMDRLEQRTHTLERFGVREVRMEFETYTTGADKLAESEAGREPVRFDHLESFYVTFGAKPYERLDGEVTINVLGNVPTNPIHEIFYEDRGKTRGLLDEEGERLELRDIERIAVYGAKFEWDEQWFQLEGFYRTGHYHWGYEGDFFGLYPEANYGEAIDTYNGKAPYGFVFSGRRWLDGLKIAFGPELYWGANPSVIAKYRRTFGPVTLTLMHHEDIAERTTVDTTFVAPQQLNRRSTVHLDMKFGVVRLEVGGIVGGTTKLGDRFVARRDGSGEAYIGTGDDFLADEIQWIDTLGAKAKLSLQMGPVSWYVQGAYKGLVADGGADQTVTYTGWTLKEDGSGNQYNVLTGVAVNIGSFQIAPNFLFQMPLKGPLPAVDDWYNPGSGNYYPSIRPRNVLDDPFMVLGNRETYGFELLLVYDPTPATWFWAWDSEIVEDAPFAGSLDFAYRIRPTSRDANIGFLADGTIFAFPDAPPAADAWDANARLFFNPRHDLRIQTRLYAGQAQAKGDDDRLVTRYGLDARLTWTKLAFETFVRVDDWGPYDYHRDFNLTFPLQLMGDLSWALRAPRWAGQAFARFGVRFDLRFLDEHSPRYAGGPVDPSDPDAVRAQDQDVDGWGHEWQFLTYVRIML